MAQQLTVDQLRSVLSETLCPDAERRRAGKLLDAKQIPSWSFFPLHKIQTAVLVGRRIYVIFVEHF
jgi:hypothetical protein